MLVVYVYVHVVAIMLFCSCKGLKVGKDLFLRRWRIVYIIMFCIGFCSGFRYYLVFRWIFRVEAFGLIMF